MRTVRIVSQRGVSAGTMVVDTETGHDIPMVMDIRISPIEVDKLVEATVKIGFVELDVEAVPTFIIGVRHPDGSWADRQVAKIVFDDGAELDLRAIYGQQSC